MGTESDDAVSSYGKLYADSMCAFASACLPVYAGDGEVGTWPYWTLARGVPEMARYLRFAVLPD